MIRYYVCIWDKESVFIYQNYKDSLLRTFFVRLPAVATRGHPKKKWDILPLCNFLSQRKEGELITDMLVSQEAPFGLPSSFKNDTFAWITWIIVKTFVFVCKKANRSEVFSYILDFFFSPVDPKHHLVAVQLQWILPPQPSPWPPCKRQK